MLKKQIINIYIWLLEMDHLIKENLISNEYINKYKSLCITQKKWAAEIKYVINLTHTKMKRSSYNFP